VLAESAAGREFGDEFAAEALGGSIRERDDEAEYD